MASTKTNPSAKDISQPNLKPSTGNDANYDRSFISGPGSSDAPAKATRRK